MCECEDPSSDCQQAVLVPAPPRPCVPSQVGTNPSAFFGFAETFGIMASRVWLAPPLPRLRVAVSRCGFRISAILSCFWFSQDGRLSLCDAACSVCVCFSCEIKSIKDVVSQRWPPVVAHEVFPPIPKRNCSLFCEFEGIVGCCVHANEQRAKC